MFDEIAVLHRARGFAVIDKPYGLPVEADSRDSVIALLSARLAPPSGGRAWPRVVHRLDRDTSGCLVVALNDKSAKALLAAFEAGEVRKEYLALVGGAPPDEDALDTAYGKDPRDGRKYTTRVQSAKRARLRYAVAERVRGAALVRVWLDTGRTHQIRVQLSEAGYPVLGDSIYGAAGLKLARESGLARQALHAARLSFPDPETGERIQCEAPIPNDIAAALRTLGGAGSR
jgi:23S rRNA pseudouridine1911/1915/1917 synthase